MHVQLESRELDPGLSTLPFCLSTAAVGLYLGLGLDKHCGKDQIDDKSSSVLIWVSLSSSRRHGIMVD